MCELIFVLKYLKKGKASGLDNISSGLDNISSKVWELETFNDNLLEVRNAFYN